MEEKTWLQAGKAGNRSRRLAGHIASALKKQRVSRK